MQIDCVTPFQGSAEELAERVCCHLNTIDPMIEVSQTEMKNTSTEVSKTNQLVLFLVIQIRIDNK